MLIYKGSNRVFTHKEAKKLRQLIENDYIELANSSLSSFSYRLDKYLISSGLSDILDLVNCTFTFIIIIFYIISTYTIPPDRNETFFTMNHLIDNIEIFLCVYLIAHFSLKLYTSQNRLIFIFTLDNLIDSGTIIAIILAHQDFIEDSSKYYLRFFRMVRIIYFTRVEHILQKRTNETVRYTYKLILYVVMIIFLSSSLTLELENDLYRELKNKSVSKIFALKGTIESYQFHDMLYFMLVTLATIGFGDITPKTTWARFTIIVTILLMLAVIPTLFQKLSTILALTSKYSRLSYKKNSNIKHLIILGSCGVEGFDAFLQELYHEDHGNVDYHTVIMQTYPDEAIMLLIKESNFSNKIFYLVGNSLLHKDLERCKADSAECVVLLANKLAKDPKNEDFSNILQAFSVKKFAKIYSGKDVRICIQLLRPETKEIYFSSLVDRDEINTQDQVICVEEIKLQLLGKSCLCPGINTIISSLITSKKPIIEESLILNSDSQWLKEYLVGMQNEIYRIKLKANIVQGLKFIDLVKIFYEVTNFIVIGVDVIFDNLDPFLCLNPYSYIFPPFDHFIYLLADRQPDNNIINNVLEKYFIRLQQNDREEMMKLLWIKNPSWIKIRSSQQEKNKTNTKFDNINKLHKKHKIQQQLNNNFLHTTLPRTGYEAENFPHEILNNHIVVCGLIQNMKNLIYPLRATSVKNEQFPILIIDKEDHIPSEIWKEIQFFPDIYFMNGDPIKPKDLHKACIKKAKAIIILTSNNIDYDSNDMIDADTIFIYKAIRNENKDVLIITDLASINTISYISSTDGKQINQGYRLTEQFAVGGIYTGSMLDTLMCQSFYNLYITDLLQQLILGSAAFNYSPELINTLKEKKVNQATLYLLNIHEELNKMDVKDIGKKVKYEFIFNRFVEKNIVPIGIYRNIVKGLSNSSRSIKVEKYVYLSPQKNDDIYIEHDRIYVLLSEDDNTKITSNDKHKQISYNNKNLKLIEKSNVLACRIQSNLKELIVFNYDCLNKSFSVKNVVDTTRSALRRGFIDVHNQVLNSNNLRRVYLDSDGS